MERRAAPSAAETCSNEASTAEERGSTTAEECRSSTVEERRVSAA